MARGSRYSNLGRIVGPQNMEQLSWIDIAKAHLHIGGVIPMPQSSISSVAGTSPTLFPTATTGNRGTNGNVPIVFETGDIVRITNVSNAAIDIAFTGAGGNDIHSPVTILPSSSIICPLPPGSLGIGHASTADLRFEFTKDD